MPAPGQDQQQCEYRLSDGTAATEDTMLPPSPSPSPQAIVGGPPHRLAAAIEKSPPSVQTHPPPQQQPAANPAADDGRGSGGGAGGDALRTFRHGSESSVAAAADGEGRMNKRGSFTDGFRAFRRRSSQASAGSLNSIGVMYDQDVSQLGGGGGEGEGEGEGEGGDGDGGAKRDDELVDLKDVNKKEEERRDYSEEAPPAGAERRASSGILYSGGGSCFRAPHNRKGSILSRRSSAADSECGGEGTHGRRRSSLLDRAAGPVVRFVKRAGSLASNPEDDDADGGDKSPTAWKLKKLRRRSSGAGSAAEEETSSGVGSRVSSLKSNRTSGTLATLNFWSKLERKQDIWDTPDYEDAAPPFSCRDCTSSAVSKAGRETRRVVLTTFRNPVILVTVLLCFACLCAAGLVTVELLARSYESALRDDALDRAAETGNWISRELDEALLPLFTLSQFVQHLDAFKALPHKIGINGEEGAAPMDPERNTTHRDVRGICDDPNVTEVFNKIAASVKRDAKMEGVLVNVQLAPSAVVCQVYPVVNTEDFPPGVSLNNTAAIGHDLLYDENRRFIARATVPASDVVIAGPLTLIQGDTPKVKEAFIARLAINMPGYRIPLDGTDYECYGFAVIILNWAALKEKVGFDAVMRNEGMEYRLTRTDVKEDPETGETTTKVATIARSDRSEEVLNEGNSVSTELQTANNMWVMTAGYEGGFRPPWEKPLQAVVVLLALVVTVMLMVMLVMKKEMQILLYKMMPPNVIKKLRRGQTVVNRYDASTIFFSDVVGFTTLSGSMSPVEVMTMLNDMYTAFDTLVAKYGAYKVDTIGDAYIVIGGGPDECLGREGAEKVARFALDAIEAVKTLTAPNGAHVLIRAGIASGPVVAGVVGTTMPKFTLFGDTVNLASRMESTGIKMKIQCNDMTYRLLRDSPNFDFHFEERNDGDDGRGVYVKGKGHTHTWWITGMEKRKAATPIGREPAAAAVGGGGGDRRESRDFDLDEFDCEGGPMDMVVEADGGSPNISPNVSANGRDVLPEEGRLEKQDTARGSNLSPPDGNADWNMKKQ